MTKEQAARQSREYAEILNRIRRGNLSFEQVISKLDSIQADVTDIKHAALHRHLTPSQQSAFSLAMRPFPGTKISIEISMGDTEAEGLAQEFVAIFRAAQLTGVEGSGMIRAIFNSTPRSFMMQANESDVAVNKVPKQCVAFLKAASDSGFGVTLVRDDSVEAGSCNLIIGTKE